MAGRYEHRPDSVPGSQDRADYAVSMPNLGYASPSRAWFAEFSGQSRFCTPDCRYIEQQAEVGGASYFSRMGNAVAVYQNKIRYRDHFFYRGNDRRSFPKEQVAGNVGKGSFFNRGRLLYEPHFRKTEETDGSERHVTGKKSIRSSNILRLFSEGPDLYAVSVPLLQRSCFLDAPGPDDVGFRHIGYNYTIFMKWISTAMPGGDMTFREEGYATLSCAAW